MSTELQLQPSRSITHKEIESVERILQMNSVFCTPVFIKTQGAPAKALGSSRGTLSIVESEHRVFMVTAGHVVKGNIRNLAFSPIGRDWQSVQLNRFDWRYISSNENTWSQNKDIDLAVAELSPSEYADIDPARIIPMEPASLYDEPFVAFISGYRNRKHNRGAVSVRGRAIPTSYGLVGDAVRSIIRPPLAEPDPPVHFTFPFDRDTVPYWEQRDRVHNTNIAPQPNGISGGPLVYCRFREQIPHPSQTPMVIGFLIEQSNEKKTVTIVTSDVIYRAVSPIAKQ